MASLSKEIDTRINQQKDEAEYKSDEHDYQVQNFVELKKIQNNSHHMDKMQDAITAVAGAGRYKPSNAKTS